MAARRLNLAGVEGTSRQTFFLRLGVSPDEVLGLRTVRHLASWLARGPSGPGRMEALLGLAAGLSFLIGAGLTLALGIHGGYAIPIAAFQAVFGGIFLLLADEALLTGRRDYLTSSEAESLFWLGALGSLSAVVVLNIPAIVFLTAFLVRWTGLDRTPKSPWPQDPQEAITWMIRERRRRLEEATLAPAAGPSEKILEGQMECPACGEPNDVERRRCRICAQSLGADSVPADRPVARVRRS